MSGYVVLDVETTGLVPWQHTIWEFGACPVDEHGRDEPEISFQIALSDNDRMKADQKALDVGRFHERYALSDYDDALAPYDAAVLIAETLKDRQIVAQPALFDLSFIKVFLWREAVAETWSHRAVHDLKTFACGAANGFTARRSRRGAFPVQALSTDDLAASAGVTIPEGRHTALVDARLTRDIARRMGAIPG